MRARDIDTGSGSVKGSPGYYMFYGMSPDGKTSLTEYHGRRSAMLMRRVDAAILKFHHAVGDAFKSAAAKIEDLREQPFVERVLARLTGNRQSLQFETDSIALAVDDQLSADQANGVSLDRATEEDTPSSAPRM